MSGRRVPLPVGGFTARCTRSTARCASVGRSWWCGAARPTRRWPPCCARPVPPRWSGTAVTSRRRSRATRELKRRLPGAASFGAGLLREPWTVATRTGGPYQVFTPFWRALQALGEPDAPLPAVRPSAPSQWPQSLTIEQLGLRPASLLGRRPGRDLDAGRAGRARPAGAVPRPCGQLRPRPARRAPPRGCRRICTSARSRPGRRGGRCARLRARRPRRSCASWPGASSPTICSTTFPPHPRSRFVPAYAGMPWRDDPAGLAAWQRGRTGYPLVDAGMRELWQTGWMHNRVRMVAASFLTKHLLIDWRRARAGSGTRWSTPTSPTTRWAGSGWPAAAPTPPRTTASSTRPRRRSGSTRDGRYRARWLGEGEAAAPIVDHAAARERALAAYGAMAVDRSNHPS